MFKINWKTRHLCEKLVCNVIWFQCSNVILSEPKFKEKRSWHLNFNLEISPKANKTDTLKICIFFKPYLNVKQLKPKPFQINVK